MILLCLLIAFALEFHFKIGSEYRNFQWFNKLRNYLVDIFSERAFFESWGGVVVILLTPVVVLYGAMNIFGDTLSWLISFVVSVTVLFLCLGPKPLEENFDDYFDALERDDLEAAYLHFRKIDINQYSDNENSSVREGENEDGKTNFQAEMDNISEKDELIRSATRKILTESQKRYFGIIAWFIFTGPLGVLFYRLSYLYHDHCATKEFDEHLPLMEQVIHWIDWIPARFTSLLFLLTGDFTNGFYRIKDYLSDAAADNNQLISETGIAALGLEMGVCDDNPEENHGAMDMVNRTVIFYLVLGAVASIVS